MNDYKKMTKQELITILSGTQINLESACHEVERLSRDVDRQNLRIQQLKNDLEMSEKTIVRLSVEETISQHMEARNG